MNTTTLQTKLVGIIGIYVFGFMALMDDGWMVSDTHDIETLQITIELQ